MFYKELPNGRYRFFEKFYDTNQEKWRQVTVTMNSKTRVSQAEARKRLALKIDKLLSQPKEERKEDTNKTLNEVCEEWQKMRSFSFKSSTLKTDLGLLSMILQTFGKRKIKTITTLDIQNHLMSGNLKLSTIRLMKSKLSMLFDYAFKLGYIDENPIDNVVIPRQASIQSTPTVITRTEMSEVLRYCEDNHKDKRHTMAMEFLFLTGLRVGELMALRYEDVDFDTCSLMVNHTLDYHTGGIKKGLLTSPKTALSKRMVSLSDRSIEILKYFRTNNVWGSDFVFLNNRGTVLSRYSLRPFVCSVCQAVLGDDRRYNLHLFRHSHITMLVEMGLPLKVIMERVGHVNEKMVLNVYSHVTQRMRDDLIDQLNVLETNQKLTKANSKM